MELCGCENLCVSTCHEKLCVVKVHKVWNLDKCHCAKGPLASEGLELVIDIGDSMPESNLSTVLFQTEEFYKSCQNLKIFWIVLL